MNQVIISVGLSYRDTCEERQGAVRRTWHLVKASSIEASDQTSEITAWLVRAAENLAIQEQHPFTAISLLKFLTHTVIYTTSCTPITLSCSFMITTLSIRTGGNTIFLIYTVLWIFLIYSIYYLFIKSENL